MRGTRLALCAAAMCLLAGSPATAAPGGLDGSFGKGGRVYASHDRYTFGLASARTADGRVVVVGSSSRSRALTAESFVLTRYLANGRPDTSFGTRGVVRTSFGGAAMGRDVFVLPDGRLLAVAMVVWRDGGGVGLARYDANGRIDKTFGRGGTSVHPVGAGTAVVMGADVGPDGSIVVAGHLWGDDRVRPFVQRYLADGKRDESFGAGGTVLMPDPPGALTLGGGVVAMPGGMVVASGFGYDDHRGYVPFLVRYLPNGYLDPTFGGTAMTDLAGTVFTGLRQTPEGLLLVAGSRGAPGVHEGPHAAMVARYLPTGTPDPTFGKGGFATVKAGSDALVNDVAVLPDGRVVGVGAAEGRTNFDTVALRFTALGVPDTTFGRGGVSIQGDPRMQDTAYHLVVGPGGTVTSTGAAWPLDRSTRYGLVSRFLGDGGSVELPLPVDRRAGESPLRAVDMGLARPELPVAAS